MSVATELIIWTTVNTHSWLLKSGGDVWPWHLEIDWFLVAAHEWLQDPNWCLLVLQVFFDTFDTLFEEVESMISIFAMQLVLLLNPHSLQFPFARHIIRWVLCYKHTKLTFATYYRTGSLKGVKRWWPKPTELGPPSGDGFQKQNYSVWWSLALAPVGIRA